jgi:hypothetical protein
MPEFRKLRLEGFREDFRLEGFRKLRQRVLHALRSEHPLEPHLSGISPDKKTLKQKASLHLQ